MKKVLWFVFPAAAVLLPQYVTTIAAIAAVVILVWIVIHTRKEVANL